MKNVLKLKNPIMINGEQVSELTYDANEINGTLFAEAEGKKKAVQGIKMSTSAAAELDSTLHLYMGYAAIIAVNPSYDFSDMERIKGYDVVQVMGIGRNFMLRSETDSQEDESDEHTETTQESTTQARSNSKKSE